MTALATGTDAMEYLTGSFVWSLIWLIVGYVLGVLTMIVWKGKKR